MAIRFYAVARHMSADAHSRLRILHTRVLSIVSLSMFNLVFYSFLTHACMHRAVSIGSLQILVNVRLDAVRRRGWSVPLRHVALLIDEELAEIPLDIIEARKSEGRGFALHPLVKRMRVVTIHVHLIYISRRFGSSRRRVPSNQST